MSNKVIVTLALAALAIIAVTGGAGIIFVLLAGAGLFIYHEVKTGKQPASPQELIDTATELPRSAKITLGTVTGAFVGAFMGIAAMGTAIAGTIPLGLLGGLLVYFKTKKQGR